MSQRFHRVFPLFLIVAGCMAASSAYAQCAGGATLANGDRVCGGGGSVAPVTPSIANATNSPTAGGGPVYAPVHDPPDAPPFPYSEEEVVSQMDEIQEAMESYNEAEFEAAEAILNGMTFDEQITYSGPVNSSTEVSFDGTLDYDYDDQLFMGQSVTPWSPATVQAVLQESEAIMETHFTPAQIAAANAMIDGMELDDIMLFGTLAVNNPLTYNIGMTGGGTPLSFEYDENSFMGEVLSDYNQSQVDAQMGAIESVLDGYSDSEVEAATDNVLAGMSIEDIMAYSGPIGTNTTTPFTIGTDSLGNPITYDFVLNSFMGTAVTPYTAAQVQTQMNTIAADIATAGFTDAELATAQSILEGMTIDEIMTYAGPLVSTGATPFQVATDSLGNPVNFTFYSQTFMGTPVTDHNPVDVQTAMDNMTDQLLGLADGDLATVQTALSGMTIDDIMAYTGDFVTTTPGATYNIGATGLSWDVPNAGSFMGTPLSGGSFYSNFTPAQMTAKAADIDAAILAAGPNAGIGNIQAVLDGMTPAAIMNYAPPYYTSQVVGAPPRTEYSFMGAVVHTVP
jgi:hypothetical protein